MGTDAASDFLTKYADDPGVAEKIRSVGEAYSDERYAQFVAVGKEHGFDFTIEDVRSAVAAGRGGAEGELTESELAGVAGGKYWKITWQTLSKWLNGGGPDTGSSGGGGVRG